MEATETTEQNTSPRYWVYAPGSNASLWENFYSEGVMALGWDDLGDLKKYKSKDEIEKELLDQSDNEKSKKINALANWEFANVMKIGDFVFVKKGRTKIVGFGKITSDYFYDENPDEFYSRRKVEWIKKGNWDVDHSLALKTLTDITNYNSNHPGFKYYYEQLLKLIGFSNVNGPDKIRELFKAWLDKNKPNSAATYFSNLNNKVQNIAIEHGFVKSSIYEVYLPEEVEQLQSKLDKLPEFHSNNAGYSNAVGRYYDFCLELAKGNTPISYWVFQANPTKVYRIIDALKDGILSSWMVNQNKSEIKIGDKVILWVSGDDAGIYALATVTSNVESFANTGSEIDYYIDPSKNDISDRVRLKMDHNLINNPILKATVLSNPYLKDIKQGMQGTNFKATKNQYEAVLEIIQSNKSESPHEGELNQILYGPPGTGKTYTTINKALQIVAPVFYKENSGDRDKLVERFRKLSFDYDTEEGQIGFITFHQSMSYEDFIEGIKPLPPSDGKKTLFYDVEPGLFKQLCSAAQLKGNFNEKIEWLKKECSELDNKSPIKIVTPGTSFSFTYRGGRTFIAKPDSSQKDVTDYRASIENIRHIYQGGSRKEVYNPTYVVEILNYLYKKGLKKYSEIKEAVQKPYVLIIDEINRGNISQIFGELITLIEKDKRIGMKESLEVTLPYSKEKFGVPPNLFIIGTMNTADRSVEALDTALRRRFTFEEMPPDSKLIKSDGKLKGKEDIVYEIDLVQVMDSINKRIEKLLDKDHLIGHSYFMAIKDLKSLKAVFQNNINPLLQEYFYGDFGKIGLVIGGGFFENEGEQKKENEKLFVPFADYDSDDLSEKAVYRLRNVINMSDEDFQKAIIKLINKPGEAKS